jgi:hypothetical protein
MSVTIDLEKIDELQAKADALLGTLRAISDALADVKKRFDALPSEDELQDFAKALPSASDLDEFAAAWNSDKLPSIDDLNEYSRAASEIGQAIIQN